MAGYLRLLVFEAGEDDSYGQNFRLAVVIAMIAMSRAVSSFMRSAGARTVPGDGSWDEEQLGRPW